MIGNIAQEFQNTTKFDLYQYFTDYKDFIENGYGYVYSYFSGESETIDAKYITTLNDLIERGRTLLKTFESFSGKLGNVGYWELEQYCQDLFDTLQRISKLPKYLKTSKTLRGYKAVTQMNYSIGKYRTIQDVANELNTTEVTMTLNNDLEEKDYEVDNLSSITAMVNNSSFGVDTIMEAPIGKNVYGHDILRKLTIADGDLSVVGCEDNVDQKADILTTLEVGDIPEYPNVGRPTSEGKSNASTNYAEIINDLNNVFNIDDMFDGVALEDISGTESDITMTLNIKTKYSYTTSKTITV